MTQFIWYARSLLTWGRFIDTVVNNRMPIPGMSPKRDSRAISTHRATLSRGKEGCL